MNSVIAPHEVYRTHMADAKLRILSAEKILAAVKPATGYVALDLEFCFLQIRRVIEAVTFGAMVREELRYAELRSIKRSANARDHGDAARDWQSPEILKHLASLTRMLCQSRTRAQKSFLLASSTSTDKRLWSIMAASLICTSEAEVFFTPRIQSVVTLWR